MSEAKNNSVLIVEDETLIAMDLQDLLEDAGYRVLGPAGSVAAAMRILGTERPDLALLDVNLGGENVFSVATELATGKARIVFLTGHSEQHLPEEHRHRPLVTKPYLPHTVLAAIERTLV
jgi:DNA-binding response OmpR family regulator